MVVSGLVRRELFGTDAAVTVRVEVSKSWHALAFIHSFDLSGTTMLGTHGLSMRLLPGNEFRLV